MGIVSIEDVSMSSHGASMTMPGYTHTGTADSGPDMAYLLLATHIAGFAIAVVMADKERGCWQFNLLLV